MRILCPTDFSEAAINGIEYAAELARQIHGTITLINVQPLALNQRVSLDSATETIDNETYLLSKSMQDTSEEIKNRYHVSCDYIMASTGEVFEKAVAREASKFDLTIIGSNGANNLYQFYFGSHSYRMAKNSDIPVIIVPDNVRYTQIKRIVFTSDYENDDHLILQQLKDFTESVNAEINVLHVSKEDSEMKRVFYQSFCNKIEELFQFDNKIHFKRLISENPAAGIESYMVECNANMLTLFFEEHGVLYRLFHDNLIKKLTSYANFPIMIFHK